MSKEKLFSITKKDFNFECVRGTGKGGQKKNKTNSAVRCTHIASGATAWSEASRQQYINKKCAFTKVVNSTDFRNWLRIEVSKRNGNLAKIEEQVDYLMHESNLKIEVSDGF